jgi:hypothetical protein
MPLREPTSPEDANRFDEKIAAFRKVKTDSLKEMAKDCYAQIMRIRNTLAPIEEDFEIAKRIIFERLLAENREAVNDPDFLIVMQTKPSPAIKDEVGLYDALTTLLVDGEPLGPELQNAVWMEEPPPPAPVKRADLTKIKALVKLYGEPVQAIIDKFVMRPPATKRLVFEPKEAQHGRGTTPNG